MGVIIQDEYLVANASYLRLLSEYDKYGSIEVAFDFDNTVYDFHKKGVSYYQMIQLLKDLKSIGCNLTCFTANEDDAFIKKFLEDNRIPFDRINENPSFFVSNSRKIYFNALLDDRAGLIQVYQELNLLVQTVKNRKT